jgi:hypothetical protein
MSQALLTIPELPEGSTQPMQGGAALLCEALSELLDELAGVIRGLTPEGYALRPVGVMPSSIGAHVRHNLDHLAAVLFDPGCRSLDYDTRERGTAVETDPAAALRAIAGLRTRLGAIREECLDRPIELTFLPAAQGPAVRLTSSLGRELAYVISHTIHHNALIAAMVRTQGGTPPPRLGYAPSTLRHLGTTICAR